MTTAAVETAGTATAALFPLSEARFVAERLFRLICRLARRDGHAAVRTEKLCAMLAQDVKRATRYSVRNVRYLLAELRKAGLVETQTDYRMLYIRPLADPPSQRRRTPAPPKSFAARPVAQPIAQPEPEKCTADCTASPGGARVGIQRLTAAGPSLKQHGAKNQSPTFEVIGIHLVENGSGLRGYASVRLGPLTIHKFRAICQPGQVPWVGVPVEAGNTPEGERRFTPLLDLPKEWKQPLSDAVVAAWRAAGGVQ